MPQHEASAAPKFIVRHEGDDGTLIENVFDFESDANAFARDLYFERVIEIVRTKAAPDHVCEWCEEPADESNAEDYDVDGWYHTADECARFAPGGSDDPRYIKSDREDWHTDG